MSVRLVVVAFVVVLAGCGDYGDDSAGPETRTTTEDAANDPEQVLRGWSQAVNAGDNVRAARYFAPNAVEVNPEGERTTLPDQATAVALNRNLQCSGRVRSVTTTRRTADAVVELGERRNGLTTCQDVGRKLRVRVTVQNGKITRLELREFAD